MVTLVPELEFPELPFPPTFTGVSALLMLLPMNQIVPFLPFFLLNILIKTRHFRYIRRAFVNLFLIIILEWTG